MGKIITQCCSTKASDQKRPHPMTVQDDLPLKSVSFNVAKNVPSENFKRSLPIYRTHINYFFHQVHSIEGDSISIEELRNQFSTPAWCDTSLWEPKSPFLQLLRSLPGSDDTSVSKLSILCLGLLCCQDDLYNKAECLFELITET